MSLDQQLNQLEQPSFTTPVNNIDMTLFTTNLMLPLKHIDSKMLWRFLEYDWLKSLLMRVFRQPPNEDIVEGSHQHAEFMCNKLYELIQLSYPKKDYRKVAFLLTQFIAVLYDLPLQTDVPDQEINKDNQPPHQDW